jgi:hypothetical protein
MRRTRTASALLIAALVAAAPLAAVAQDSQDPYRKPQENLVVTSDAFLNAHPDLKYRLSGLARHSEQDWARAVEDFRRAARYGDKPAQGMLAEMAWNGQGVEVDRAIAYAWMDIAAERGYPVFVGKREQYWAALTPAERERAVAVGTGMYDEYGDPASKPRLERLLKKARRETTGSRVGSVGNLTIIVPTPNGNREVRGDAFYADKFWEPAQYWTWQDQDWKAPARGDVTVGEVMTGAPPATDD